MMMVLTTVAIYGFESIGAARAQTFKLTILLNVLACIGLATGALSRLPRALRHQSDRWLRRKPTWLLAGAAGLFVVAVLGRWSPKHDSAAGVAHWAYEYTPREAVFAVPPSMDGFRVRSERAVVATWKSVPFRADLAAEWWRRLHLAAPLTEAPRRGSGLLESLDAAYARQTDADRLALADSLGVRYAVVPKGTETRLPVEHDDGRWQVLRLE